MKIPTACISEVEARLTKLRKKADKLGLPRPELVIGEREIRTTKDDHGHECVIDETNVTVSISVLKYADYEFVAALDRVGEENLVKKAPAFRAMELPVIYRTRFVCDHCKKPRLRKKTLLLRNASGEFIQVGTACLIDFMGYDVERVLTYFYLFSDDALGGEGGYRGRGERIHDFEYILTLSACAVRQYGYVSRKKAEETGFLSTAGRVSAHLSVFRKPEDVLPVQDCDKEKALRVLEWSKTIDSANDYYHNMRLAFSGIGVDSKVFGIIVSAINAYDRETEPKTLERPAGESNWVGQVKERRVFNLTIKRIRRFESAFGPMAAVSMVDSDNNEFVWFTAKGFDASDNEPVQLKGTIKEHSIYNGRKQTVLTRCSFIGNPVLST